MDTGQRERDGKDILEKKQVLRHMEGDFARLCRLYAERNAGVRVGDHVWLEDTTGGLWVVESVDPRVDDFGKLQVSVSLLESDYGNHMRRTYDLARIGGIVKGLQWLPLRAPDKHAATRSWLEERLSVIRSQKINLRMALARYALNYQSIEHNASVRVRSEGDALWMPSHPAAEIEKGRVVIYYWIAKLERDEKGRVYLPYETEQRRIKQGYLVQVAAPLQRA